MVREQRADSADDSSSSGQREFSKLEFSLSQQSRPRSRPPFRDRLALHRHFESAFITLANLDFQPPAEPTRKLYISCRCSQAFDRTSAFALLFKWRSGKILVQSDKA